MSFVRTPEEVLSIRRCFTEVQRNGRYLSAAMEDVFRQLRPHPVHATAIRQTLFDAIRYNDVEGALQGAYRGGPDPEKSNISNDLRDLVASAFGTTANNVLASILTDASTFIRVNTLKTTVAQCAHTLAPFQPVVLDGQVLRIDAPFGLFSCDAFSAGWFEQQDITSQRAGNALAAQPGERIVDACAGAGGKTLLFAAAMQNRGRIIALDTNEQRLQALRQRMIRSGAHIVEPRLITTTKVVKRLAEQAHGVFVDVPCTGTGVMRRNPDMISRFAMESYTSLLSQQADILRRSAAIVRPGGRFVYATCSFLPGEGVHQISNFLATEFGQQFRLTNQWQTLPGENGGDGFYVAYLTRSDGA